MVSFARQLRTQYKTALLSNAPSGFIRRLLEQYGIKDIFDHIVISGEIGLVKPSKDAFLYTLTEMNASPEKTIFIDDNSENVDAARELGLTSFVFKDVDHLKSELAAKYIKF